MRVVAIVNDLILFSRIDAAAAAGNARLTRLDNLFELPPATHVDLLLVDWSSRAPEWGGEIATWRSGAAVRVIAFGRHTDLDAHAAARSSGIGPMWARSKLVAELPGLLRTAGRLSPGSPELETSR